MAIGGPPFYWVSSVYLFLRYVMDAKKTIAPPGISDNIGALARMEKRGIHPIIGGIAQAFALGRDFTADAERAGIHVRTNMPHLRLAILSMR